jgi:outer membrane receptor for ferrienterochelin and colicins
MKWWFALGACLMLAASLAAAEPATGTLVVRVRSGAAPIPSADVTAGGVTARTDVQGEARLALPAGEQVVMVVRAGFAPATFTVRVRAGEEVVTIAQLQEQRLESHVTVVSATRSGTLIEDQPIRVEAVPQEEIEENQTIAPGNLTTLLNELGGLHVQTTVPSLGGSELRLQGLRGRYTQILTDELPLYGQEPDAFSLLQVPPLDLAQVEVIKGTTSALYGGSALGGVVNLVSRRPGGEPEFLVNQTSHLGTDAVGFVPGTMHNHWGCTLLGSAHRQDERDLDGDGWADLPGFRRVVLRPRLYWDDGGGHSLFATLGGMKEDREGGILEGAATPAGGPFRDTLGTRRLDGGLVGRFLLQGGQLLSVHGSLERTWRKRRLGGNREDDLRDSDYAEVSLAGTVHGHTWAIGTAWQQDDLHGHDDSGLDYRYTVPAVFVQDEYALSRKFSVAANARADFHNVYGTFFNPRISVLVRPDEHLNVRVSVGTGYAAPVPFTERTEESGLSRLLPLADLEPERAQSASIDLGWSGGGLELNGTLFASRVGHALLTRDAVADPGRLEIVNAGEPTRTAGTELIVRYSRHLVQVIGTYTYLHATESDPQGPGRREVPLTPRHTAELAGILESESRGRIGAELSYTGRQSLEDDPYRSVSRSYVEVGVLGEVRIGELHVYLNAENLTGVRQTHYDPLLLPAQALDGRWTTGVWAPLEGRVFNAGVRIEF